MSRREEILSDILAFFCCDCLFGMKQEKEKKLVTKEWRLTNRITIKASHVNIQREKKTVTSLQSVNVVYEGLGRLFENP